MSMHLVKWIIMILLSGGVAFVAHKKIKNYIAACVISGMVSSALFQIVDVVSLGHLDPFFLFAFASGAVLAFVIAIIVGIPFAYLRFKRERTESGLDAREEGEND